MRTGASAKLDTIDMNRLIKRASWAAFGVSIVLIIFKVIAWVLTGSVVILTTFVDSLMDALSTGLNLIAVRYALQPADDDHRFGHGKAEGLAALTQATFIAGSAFFLMIQAVDRLLHPRDLSDTGIGLSIMFFSMLVTAFLVIYQRYVIKKTASLVIKAVSLNFSMDLVSNFFVIIALGLSSFGLTWVDPVFALFIGCLIFYNAYQIGIEAIHGLMDRELPDAMKADILKLAASVTNIQNIHSFRTRQSGSLFFIYLHLDIPRDLSFQDAHTASVNVINIIQKHYPNAEVFAHQDPADRHDPANKHDPSNQHNPANHQNPTDRRNNN
ncbi:ferrous iron and zinc transporter [Gammaproteobacteria bacterium]|nr:ferrous iron and zinc transporter [Gammaproteobacteria bacterium]